MASNQLPVAEKARLISDNFRVPMEDVERINRKELASCTPLETYIKQGNIQIPFDMVREIQKKEVADCSVLELKIRYNDSDMGNLAQWVDIDRVDSIIKREVNTSWTGKLEPLYSRNDIYNACWEKVLLKSKEINSVGKDDYEKFICRIVKWHISNFYCYHKKHSKYINFKLSTNSTTSYLSTKDTVHRLPEVFYNWNEKDKELREADKFVYIEDSSSRNVEEENRILDSIEEEMDMLNTIKSINDDTIRDLLSIAAYVLAQLDSFKELYDDAVARMTDSKRLKFYEMIKNKDDKGLNFKKVLKLLVGKESATYFNLLSDYLQDIISNSKRLAEI